MTSKSIPKETASNTWEDAGYMYSVTREWFPTGIQVTVSRVLVAGKTSSLAGQGMFSLKDASALESILATAGPTRTELVDEIIHGGTLSLADTLNRRLAQPELWDRVRRRTARQRGSESSVS